MDIPIRDSGRENDILLKKGCSWPIAVLAQDSSKGCTGGGLACRLHLLQLLELGLRFLALLEKVLLKGLCPPLVEAGGVHDDGPIGPNGRFRCNVYDIPPKLVERRIALRVLRQNAGINSTPIRPGPILNLLFLRKRRRQPGDESNAFACDEAKVLLRHHGGVGDVDQLREMISEPLHQRPDGSPIPNLVRFVAVQSAA